MPNRRSILLGAIALFTPHIARAVTTENLVAGGVSALTSCGFTASDFNSLANLSTVVAASNVSNSSNLDLWAQIAFTVEVGGTTTQSSVFNFYVLESGISGVYGDGAATGTTLPAAHQLATTCNVKGGVTTGNAVTGVSRFFPLPRVDFKFACGNFLGVALDSSAAADFKYLTTNRKFVENLYGKEYADLLLMGGAPGSEPEQAALLAHWNKHAGVLA